MNNACYRIPNDAENPKFIELRGGGGGLNGGTCIGLPGYLIFDFLKGCHI